jgi:hypothetical protein
MVKVNWTSGSINGQGFPDQLNNYQILKNKIGKKKEWKKEKKRFCSVELNIQSIRRWLCVIECDQVLSLGGVITTNATAWCSYNMSPQMIDGLSLRIETDR